MRWLSRLVALGLVACGSASDATTDAAPAPRDAAAEAPPAIVLAIDPVDLDVGAEVTDRCESFALENDEPLYLNAVAMDATAGFHHSNWFYVPDSLYDGPDGGWRCADRGFDQLVAGVRGGVLFAQSTQATRETQQFAPGAALRVPPHSRVVGQLHMVNASGGALRAAMTLTLRPIAAASVADRLSPMVLSYERLDIPPHARSRFTARCDLGATLDAGIFYTLPHYHAHGRRARLAFSDGAAERTVIDSMGTIGDVVSRTYDPPLLLDGQRSVTYGCEFDNEGASPIGWGNAAGEMCIVFVWQNSGFRWAATVTSSAVTGADADGTVLNEAECSAVRIPEAR